MPVRAPVSPEVMEWAFHRAPDQDALAHAFPKIHEWLTGASLPTVKQLTKFASRTRTPFGYFFLEEPPELNLPVRDFREGFDEKSLQEPSADLLAVLNLSIRRQDWYRDYAIENEMPDVEVVGSAKGKHAVDTAAHMRDILDYEVHQRRGNWADQRKYLLKAFESVGGLTVATSMVENNTQRMLDPDEFRGFSLVDGRAPLVFLNANQSINGQLFTLGHEFAHIWRGVGGVSLEDMRWQPQSEVERWCNLVASELLVPKEDLERRYTQLKNLDLTETLDELAKIYRCGTLVVLHSLHWARLREFYNFQEVYEAELNRLKTIADNKAPKKSGQFLLNQPYRIGERFSRAVISDAIAGNTPLNEAIRLTSLKSVSNFDEYADHLKVRTS